jgi:hypothetical protein
LLRIYIKWQVVVIEEVVVQERLVLREHSKPPQDVLLHYKNPQRRLQVLPKQRQSPHQRLKLLPKQKPKLLLLLKPKPKQKPKLLPKHKYKINN